MREFGLEVWDWSRPGWMREVDRTVEVEDCAWCARDVEALDILFISLNLISVYTTSLEECLDG